MQKIIDTHVHVWDLTKLQLPWLASVPALNRSMVIEDYQEAIQAPNFHMAGAIYIEVDVAPQQQVKENTLILTCIQEGQTLFKGATISADLSSERFTDYFANYAANPAVKGVRQVLHVPERAKGFCLSPTFIKNVSLLGQHGKLFEGCVRTEELGDLITLAQKVPETVIVLDHMGNPDAQVIAKAAPIPAEIGYRERWQENISKLAQLPNVVCKVSGLNPVHPFTFVALQPTIEYVFQAFGEDKILFASNYPVCDLSMSLSQWVNGLLSLCAHYSAEFSDKFFFHNAERIYSLKTNNQ